MTKIQLVKNNKNPPKVLKNMLFLNIGQFCRQRIKFTKKFCLFFSKLYWFKFFRFFWCIFGPSFVFKFYIIYKWKRNFFSFFRLNYLLKNLLSKDRFCFAPFKLLNFEDYFYKKSFFKIFWKNLYHLKIRLSKL